MIVLRRFLLVLSLLLLGAAPVVAHPALWVARDADTTVYLFGTVHLLPDDTAWHFPALERALDDSQALYVEVADVDPLRMQALVMRHGLDPSHPLSAKLSDSEQTLLRKAAVTAGLPGGARMLQPMRPWLAALTLAVTPLLKAGLDPEHGVDKLMQARMRKAGKPVHGLETAEQQIRFLADMPESVQLDFLRSTLRAFNHAGIELKTLIDAWKHGDVATIARIEDTQMRVKSPRLYQRLLVTRNKTWAGQIADLMQQPGTVFIAVGAAHLAGPDRLQAQLAGLGIHAERVP